MREDATQSDAGGEGRGQEEHRLKARIQWREALRFDRSRHTGRRERRCLRIHSIPASRRATSSPRAERGIHADSITHVSNNSGSTSVMNREGRSKIVRTPSRAMRG